MTSIFPDVRLQAPPNCAVTTYSRTKILLIEEACIYAAVFSFVFYCHLTVLLGLGPSQGIPRLWLQDFSQSFPAMLMRLVGTADTAGDWEKAGARSL